MMPIDGSDHSKRAFDWYLDNEYMKGDSIVFVHIVLPVREGSLFVDRLSIDMTKSIEDSKQIAHYYRTKCRERKIGYKTRMMVNLRVGPTLIKEAAKCNASLIVMSHGSKSTMQEVILGSTSKYMLGHCPVPTILVQNH